VVGVPSSRVIAVTSSDRTAHTLYAAVDPTDDRAMQRVLARVQRGQPPQ